MSIFRRDRHSVPVAMPGVKMEARAEAHGEIVIDFNHVKCWRARLMRRAPRRPRSRKNGAKLMLSMLHDIHQESAIYLMVRRLRD